MEKTAPAFPTLPAKVLCVCEDPTSTGRTYAGFLNSLVHGGAVILLCAFPGGNTGGTEHLFNACQSFTVIK